MLIQAAFAGNNEVEFVSQIRSRLSPCQRNVLFSLAPHIYLGPYEQSEPVNIRARNSICELFNFHRLVISRLTTRYYGVLNYYARHDRVYSCIYNIYIYIAIFGSHAAPPFRKRAGSDAYSK